LETHGAIPAGKTSPNGLEISLPGNEISLIGNKISSPGNEISLIRSETFVVNIAGTFRSGKNG